MTVGELKRFIEDLDDDIIVVTSEYNSGSGGLFEAGAEVGTEMTIRGYQRKEIVAKALMIGPTFG
jgi:hypothetical protein